MNDTVTPEKARVIVYCQVSLMIATVLVELYLVQRGRVLYCVAEW